MIQNPRVLEDRFVPREVEHRNDEMNALTNALTPITDGRSALPTFLLGPSGAGKTCLAHVALGRLREAAPSVAYQYVSCWEEYSRFGVLYTLVQAVESSTIDRRAETTGALIDRLQDIERQFVVVLDEADQLHDTKVLFDLYQLPAVSIILIVNRIEDLFARVDDRIVSRLRSGARVRLDKYGVAELVSILAERVRLGLRPGAITRDQLATIADAAAGDARVAINILRCAAEQAARTDAETITATAVNDAVATAVDDVQHKQLDELSPHPRAVYEIIRERGSVGGGTLHDAYHERVEDPRSERTVRNYLKKLTHYDLIRADGNGSARTYHVVD